MPIEHNQLSGKRVAALVTDGFEQVELIEPVQALRKAGASVDVVIPKGEQARGWNHKDWGDSVAADATLDKADPAQYDALLLPGGVMSPDHLRMDERAVAFVRSFVNSEKPIAAICHGPWTLINAGAVAGRALTSYPSLRLDLENAGASWVDQEVVVDGTLITSRKPDDLPAFNRAMIEVIGSVRGENGQPSSAPNASFATGAGHQGVENDTDVLAGNTLSNEAYPQGNKYSE
jgi:protease I